MEKAEEAAKELVLSFIRELGPLRFGEDIRMINSFLAGVQWLAGELEKKRTWASNCKNIFVIPTSAVEEVLK